MAKRQNRKKVGPTVAHKSDKITPAAVALRRKVATLMTDGPMPPFLCHMNIGQMEELQVELQVMATQLNAKAGDCITGNLLAMNEAQFRHAMNEARNRHTASVTEVALRFAEYNDCGCPVHIAPPVLDWH